MLKPTSKLIVNEQKWLNLKRDFKGMDDMCTKIGLPQEGTPKQVVDAHSNKMVDLVQIAAVHEFGAPRRRVPERSFIRSTFDDNRGALKNLVTRCYNAVIDGKFTPVQALSTVGEYLVGKTKNKIRNRIPPPLSPATIKAKTVGGKTGDVPLIDTAQLIQSIQHVEGPIA